MVKVRVWLNLMVRVTVNGVMLELGSRTGDNVRDGDARGVRTHDRGKRFPELPPNGVIYSASWLNVRHARPPSQGLLMKRTLARRRRPAPRDHRYVARARETIELGSRGGRALPVSNDD